MDENQKPEENKTEDFKGYTGLQPHLTKISFIEMNLGQLFLGLILIFGGFIFLAKNMGWLEFKIAIELQRFWPIFLIFGGLAMIKTRSLLTTILGIVAVFLTFGVVVWVIFGLGPCGFGN